ncbi:MAG: HD domain-containing protein [Dinghuibacter sp.]|nr:HD domain-containing protein [Dinghuibacter sp.]
MNNNSIIEQVLHNNSGYLNKHLEKYRNHVYRVYHRCRLYDATPGNDEKYAIAAVFHDIGIWTNNTFDYLEPSISLASNYLEQTGRPELTEEIGLMIGMHHKISRYTGPYAHTVEAFRKADWADLTWGIVRFGLNKKGFSPIVRQFPTKGFHRFLVKKTIANFFAHPLKPLPMFKR